MENILLFRRAAERFELEIGTSPAKLDSFAERSEAGVAMRATRHVDRRFASLAIDPMGDHAFLTKEGTLEQTHFSSGRSMQVNFAPEP
jgi:hypothetical protein